MSDWKQDAITRLVGQYGSVPPPWVIFPDEHPYSICWRMGAGESHVIIWGEWWEHQQLDEQQRVDYFRNWPPPGRWLTWMIDAIWNIHPWEYEEDFDYTPYFKRTEALGFGNERDYAQDINDPKWLGIEESDDDRSNE